MSITKKSHFHCGYWQPFCFFSCRWPWNVKITIPMKSVYSRMNSMFLISYNALGPGAVVKPSCLLGKSEIAGSSTALAFKSQRSRVFLCLIARNNLILWGAMDRTIVTIVIHHLWTNLAKIYPKQDIEGWGIRIRSWMMLSKHHIAQMAAAYDQA